jgi:hypothetical protein
MKTLFIQELHTFHEYLAAEEYTRILKIPLDWFASTGGTVRITSKRFLTGEHKV